MNDETRFAVCGIDCMTCSIHLRTEEELEYQQSQNRDPDKVACNGCRSNTNACLGVEYPYDSLRGTGVINDWGKDCVLLNCCIYEKGLDFCGECSDFPCDKVTEWAGEWEHHRTAVEKMKEMKALGKEDWIRQRLAECN